MLDFLKKFKSFKSNFSGSYVSVDIGTASIKTAVIDKSGGTPVIKNYAILESHGHLDRVNNAIQTSSLKILDTETAEMLKKLFKEMGVSTVNVVASLPAFSVFTSLLEMPSMSSEEMAQAIQFQARSFVPLPLTEITIDWIPVGEYTDDKGTKKQRIFLVAIPNEQIHKYKQIFQLAGLKLTTLEVETLSLARLLTEGDPSDTLIVDIGARSTAIAVAAGGTIKLNAQTDFAGSSLTQAIARGLGINVQRAEDLKRQRGITGTGGEYQISTLMLPYLDVILNEVRRVKDEYEKTYRAKVSRIIFSGGGANLIGIEKYAFDQFRLPVIKAQPFDRIRYTSEISPLINELGAPLSVALGLGLGRFAGK
jgi:type IV pilus assembly protein PilM